MLCVVLVQGLCLVLNSVQSCMFVVCLFVFMRLCKIIQGAVKVLFILNLNDNTNVMVNKLCSKQTCFTLVAASALNGKNKCSLLNCYQVH